MPKWDALRGNRVILDLPLAETDDLVAAGEVLLQEELSAWVLPLAGLSHLPTLCRVFGHRAVIGVQGVRTAADVSAAKFAGAAFALSPFCSAGLIDPEGFPVALGGLTPNEVGAAALLSGAVQVFPCDAMGSGYGHSLPVLFPDVPLVATGKMERYLMELWLEAGAAAVCPRGWIPLDDVTDPDLSELRRRCQGLSFDDV